MPDHKDRARRLAELERQLQEAGDRRDWDWCDRIEEEQIQIEEEELAARVDSKGGDI